LLHDNCSHKIANDVDAMENALLSDDESLARDIYKKVRIMLRLQNISRSVVTLIVSRLMAFVYTRG